MVVAQTRCSFHLVGCNSWCNICKGSHICYGHCIAPIEVFHHRNLTIRSTIDEIMATNFQLTNRRVASRAIRCNGKGQVTVCTNLVFGCSNIGFCRDALIGGNRITRSICRNGHCTVVCELNIYRNSLIQAFNGQRVGKVVIHLHAEFCHVRSGNRRTINTPLCNHVSATRRSSKHQLRTSFDSLLLVCIQRQRCTILSRTKCTVVTYHCVTDLIADRLSKHHGYLMLCLYVIQRVSELVCRVSNIFAVQFPCLYMIILVRFGRKGQVGACRHCDGTVVTVLCGHSTASRIIDLILHLMGLLIRHKDCPNIVGVHRRGLISLAMGDRPNQTIRGLLILRSVHGPMVKLVSVCGCCRKGKSFPSTDLSRATVISSSCNRSVRAAPGDRILHRLEGHRNGRTYGTRCFRRVRKCIAAFALLYTVDRPLFHFVACHRFCCDFNRCTRV